MRTFDGESFGPFFDDGGTVFEDLTFRGCRFLGSALSITEDVSRRSLVRNVAIRDCAQSKCTVQAAIIDSVTVENLNNATLLQAWAAVFRHVTLKGSIGRLMLSDKVSGGLAAEPVQRAFDDARSSFYSNIDWALDLSEAEFTDEPDIRGVPAHLIRRDPKTQIVVTRDRAMTGSWRKLDLSRTFWGAYIQGMLNDGYPDVVLVGPKKSRRFKHLLAGLERLRDAGVGE